MRYTETQVKGASIPKDQSLGAMHYATNDVNSNFSTALSSPASINKSMNMPPITTFQSLQTTMIPTLEGMDLAGRLLEWQMKNDNLFPQLSDQLRVGQDGNFFSILAKKQQLH